MEIAEDYTPSEETEGKESAGVVNTVTRYRKVLLDFLPSVENEEVTEAIQWTLDNQLSKVGRRVIRTPEEVEADKARQKEVNKRLREQREAARIATQKILVKALRHPVIGEQLREFNMPVVVDWFNPDNGFVNGDGTISVFFDRNGFVRPRDIETEFVNGVPMTALLIAHAEATAVVERTARNRRWQLVSVDDGEMQELEFD